MSRTQLNINIDPELLQELKTAAIRAGKTTTEFVSESIANYLEKYSPNDTLDSRMMLLEERISLLEEKLYPDSVSQAMTIFSEEEAYNCSKFFKSIFDREFKRRQFSTRKDAWNDLIGYIDCFDQWDDIYTLRLKEIFFIKDGDPFTSDEMKRLAKGKVCTSPIRTGLINWINSNSEKGKCLCFDTRFPSQQAICIKGSKLVDELYSSDNTFNFGDI